MKLLTLDKATVSGKRVFVRGDVDVPIKDGKIADDTRLRDIWLTVEYLLKQDCTVLLAGHLGRPASAKATAGKPEGLSSEPVAKWFADKVGGSVSGVCLKNNICGFIVTEKFVVLENLRFDPREEANDEGYAKELAGLAEVYVNEAFAASEREHASIVGVPKFLPHYGGFRLAREMEVLSGVLESPKRPLVAVIGGAKPETKLPLITKMKTIADTIITKDDLVPTSGGLDVTLDSIEKFAEAFSTAGTIFWNGPVGKIEEIPYQVGTRKLAELIAASPAYKVVGGGDTVGFLDRLGLTDKFDWVSSGGGSMLKLLVGEKLPGVEALLG